MMVGSARTVCFILNEHFWYSGQRVKLTKSITERKKTTTFPKMKREKNTDSAHDQYDTYGAVAYKPNTHWDTKSDCNIERAHTQQ